jgi:hypothetical protein
LTGWALTGLKKKIMKYQPKGKTKFGEACETIKGFCLLISVTSLSKPSTGIDSDE